MLPPNRVKTHFTARVVMCMRTRIGFTRTTSSSGVHLVIAYHTNGVERSLDLDGKASFDELADIVVQVLSGKSEMNADLLDR